MRTLDPSHTTKMMQRTVTEPFVEGRYFYPLHLRQIGPVARRTNEPVATERELLVGRQTAVLAGGRQPLHRCRNASNPPFVVTRRKLNTNASAIGSVMSDFPSRE